MIAAPSVMATFRARSTDQPRPAEQAADHGADVGNPGKNADLLHIKPEGFRQVNRQPRDKQPPDRVEEKASPNDPPALSVRQDLAQGGLIGGSLWPFTRHSLGGVQDQGTLGRIDPRVAGRPRLVDNQPGQQPDKANQPHQNEGEFPPDQQEKPCDQRC